MAYNIPQNLVKLASTTASSSASVSFTSQITSSFSTYVVKIRAAVPATNATQLLMTFSTNNGSSYLSSNYKYGYSTAGWLDANWNGNDSASSIILHVSNQSNSSSSFLNVNMFLYNLNSGTYSPTCNLQSVCMPSSATTDVQFLTNGGMNTTTTAVNAIKFAYSSGNIASGTFILYGVKEP